MEHRDSLPEDVQRFILLGIPSVPYLEALLLMRGDPARTWTCQDVARRLYLSEKAAHSVMVELTASGVARNGDASTSGGERQDLDNQTSDGTCATMSVHYAPQRPELQAMIDRLADIYPRQIVAVSELIHSKARHNRAQQFADAFVLRRENP